MLGSGLVIGASDSKSRADDSDSQAVTNGFSQLATETQSTSVITFTAIKKKSPQLNFLAIK